MTGGGVTEDVHDAAHGIPGIAEQVRRARRAREIDHAFQIRRAARPELPRQVLSRYAQRLGDMPCLGRDAGAAQHFVPRGELQAIGQPQQPGRVRQRRTARHLCRARRDPFPCDRIVHALDQYTEPRITTGLEQRTIVRADRGERVHRDAWKARGQRQPLAITMANVDDDGIDEPLREQPLDRLKTPTQPHTAGAARITALDRAPRLAARMEHGHDRIRGGRGGHVCTSACCISAACSNTSRALS